MKQYIKNLKKLQEKKIVNGKEQFNDTIIIIIGSLIVAFAICNIHSKSHIAEGGQLGFELLLFNLFKISPSISSVIIDCISYIIAIFILGKRFFKNAIIGTLSYSIFYFIFEHSFFIYLKPIDNLLINSIIGGILVGIGCGMVVRKCGSCGGDDSLALVLSKITKLPISICYFCMDVFVILLSLIYIDIKIIVYSLITSAISSFIIGYIADSKYERKNNNNKDVKSC